MKTHLTSISEVGSKSAGQAMSHPWRYPCARTASSPLCRKTLQSRKLDVALTGRLIRRWASWRLSGLFRRNSSLLAAWTWRSSWLETEPLTGAHQTPNSCKSIFRDPYNCPVIVNKHHPGITSTRTRLVAPLCFRKTKRPCLAAYFLTTSRTLNPCRNRNRSTKIFLRKSSKRQWPECSWRATKKIPKIDSFLIEIRLKLQWLVLNYIIAYF